MLLGEAARVEDEAGLVLRLPRSSRLRAVVLSQATAGPLGFQRLYMENPAALLPLKRFSNEDEFSLR
jgi:hypothetical protein